MEGNLVVGLMNCFRSGQSSRPAPFLFHDRDNYYAPRMSSFEMSNYVRNFTSSQLCTIWRSAPRRSHATDITGFHMTSEISTGHPGLGLHNIRETREGFLPAERTEVDRDHLRQSRDRKRRFIARAHPALFIHSSHWRSSQTKCSASLFD